MNKSSRLGIKEETVRVSWQSNELIERSARKKAAFANDIASLNNPYITRSAFIRRYRTLRRTITIS